MDVLEEARIVAASKSFSAFLSRIDIPGVQSLYRREEDRFTGPARALPLHQQVAARIIDRIMSGEIENALFFWPPGTAKSTTISVCAPAYYLGRTDQGRSLCTSHGSKLAWSLSRRTRNLCRSPAFQRIFNAGLDPATRAVDEWALTNGSEMIAGAIDGVVGRRGGFNVYDDPLKNRKEAESPVIRAKVRAAIEDDLQSRTFPPNDAPGGVGCLLGMFTRYVFDDPALWFLGEDYQGQSGFVNGVDGRRYFVMNCPAQAEFDDDPLGRVIGEYIWPERFKPEFWAPFKKVERTWSSLYQQRPSARAGLFFRREWFKIIPLADVAKEVPKYGIRCRAYDAAATEEDEAKANDPDYSASVKAGRFGERVIIEHAERSRSSPANVEKIMRELARSDGFGVRVRIPQDPGQAGKDQAQRRAAMMRSLGCLDVRTAPVSGSKVLRAETLAAEAEKGNVYLIEGEWNQAFIDELCAFPVGLHDDFVDAAADACNELMSGATFQTVKVVRG